MGFLSDLLYVPHCAACDTRLPPGVRVPLCPFCRGKYENEKEVTCPSCAGRMGDCFCLPPDVPSKGIHKMLKLVRYRPAESDVSASMIYTLKHHNEAHVQRFIAEELALPLSRLVEAGKNDEWVVTFPPRSKAGRRKEGFDHAARLAKHLASCLGCAYMPTLLRIDGQGGEQKHRSRTARFAAADAGYALRPSVKLNGKKVILVDDICTTGATLLACAGILRREGKAQEVIPAVLALTPSKRGRPGHL